MKERFVTIRHPQMGVESRVQKSTVRVWVKKGWVLADGDQVPGSDDQIVFDFDKTDEPSPASEKE